MPKVSTRSPITVIVHAEHRNGICIECGSRMEVRDVDIGGKIRKRAVCPKCGGMTGQLIARPISIQSPPPPSCISFKCLGKFIKDSLFSALLSSYHFRRVAYAESHYYKADSVGGEWRIRRAGINPNTNNRYPYERQVYATYEEAIKETTRISGKVLERYRTGEPAPKTLWQAIHANIKLSCPICRKYDIDPFLGGKRNGSN
jgi:hypothetical protein